MSSLPSSSFLEQSGTRSANELIPASVAAYIWRGNEVGTRAASIVASGFRALDSELPGGGWPCQALTEIMSDQGAHAEWRLLASAIRRIQKRGATVFVLGAPHVPHVPGLRLVGIDERRLVRVQVDSVRDRLWATQQILQSGQAGAVMTWFPKVDARALRRLQACAQGCDAPVFVMRPSSAQHDTSPAPLRVEVMLGVEAWKLQLKVLKRRGPQLDKLIELPSVPGGLTQLLARRAAAAGAASRPVPLQTPAPLLVPASTEAASSISTSSTTVTPLPASIPFIRPASLPTTQPLPELIDEPLAGAVLPTPLRAVAG